MRAGEVVGLAGLVGSGKSEMAGPCFGAGAGRGRRASPSRREMSPAATPRAMLDRGIFYMPPDRRERGPGDGPRRAREHRPAVARPAAPSPARLFLAAGASGAQTRELAQRLNLQPLNVERPVDHFSGGNQQKVMLAKALAREVRLFIFDEPTVGVDVGTRVAIYGFIRDLCEAGAAILLISSDLPEILHLAHRVYVMYRGQLRAELGGAEITEDRVLGHFFEREAA